MKINLTTVLMVLVVALMATTAIFFNNWRTERENSVRWEGNYESLKEDNHTLHLTIGEFKDQLNEKMDSVLKVANVKANHIKYITNVTNKYIDTTIVEAPVVKVDKSKYQFTDSTKCMTIKGIVDISLDTPRVVVTDRLFQNEQSYIAYWERRKWKCLFFKTRILGKKETKLKVVNMCGDVSWQKIDIIKE